MPDGILPGLSLLSDQLSSAQNASDTAMQNAKSQRFSEKMYEKQKFDARVNWGLQNEYNSPANQMKRFQEAGLNPNLIYGQGNPGNSGNIPLADAQTPSFTPTRSGDGFRGAGAGVMNGIYDIQQKKLVNDNLRDQNSVILQDALLKKAQTDAVIAGTDTSRFKLGFESDLRGISAQTRGEQLRQLQITNDVAIDENARRALMNATSIQEAGQRMLNMEQQRGTGLIEQQRMRTNIQGMIKDNTLKDMDIQLRKLGIMPGDPMWSRIAGRLLSGAIDNPTKAVAPYAKQMFDFLPFK
jgi:hypothetical protein